MDPVHGNALWGLNPTADYYSVARGVTGHVDLGAVRKETRVERLSLERGIALYAVQPTSQSLVHNGKSVSDILQLHIQGFWCTTRAYLNQKTP